MTLSCSCDFIDDDTARYSYPSSNYVSMPDRKRRYRCSCGKLINTGESVVKFRITRMPQTWVEEKIYGDEVTMAPMYLCETCSDLYYSLIDLGFDCVWPSDNMKSLVKEYHETYGK